MRQPLIPLRYLLGGNQWREAPKRLRTLKKGEEERQIWAIPYFSRTTNRSKGLSLYYLYSSSRSQTCGVFDWPSGDQTMVVRTFWTWWAVTRNYAAAPDPTIPTYIRACRYGRQRGPLAPIKRKKIQCWGELFIPISSSDATTTGHTFTQQLVVTREDVSKLFSLRNCFLFCWGQSTTNQDSQVGMKPWCHTTSEKAHNDGQ